MSRALRAYALLAVAAGGWMAGRAPAMVDAFVAERGALAGPPRVQAAPPPERTAEMAAVAAEAARATVMQMLAAGWRPPGAPVPVVMAPEPAAVRVITVAAPPAQPAARGWSLPPEAPGRVGEPPAAPALVATKAAAPAASDSAWAAADAGYAAWRRGDRRTAAAQLGAALALEGDTNRARTWAADRARLMDRWVGEAYSVSRPGPGSQLAASPVLGGGQIGGSVTWTPNPLARRPVSVLARLSAGQDASGRIDTDATEGALGVRWRPVEGVSLDAERRFAVGAFGRGGWGLRAAGGAARDVRVAGVALGLDGYSEAGAVWRSGGTTVYGGAQARAGSRLATVGGVSLNAGAGVWAAGQSGGGARVGRVDAGPSLRVSGRRLPFDVQADYRARLAGNAAPGSGAVVTVTGRF